MIASQASANDAVLNQVAAAMLKTNDEIRQSSREFLAERSARAAAAGGPQP